MDHQGSPQIKNQHFVVVVSDFFKLKIISFPSSFLELNSYFEVGEY